MTAVSRDAIPAAVTPDGLYVGGGSNCFRFATGRRDAIRDVIDKTIDTLNCLTVTTSGLYQGYPRLLARTSQWCERWELRGDGNATAVTAYGYTAKAKNRHGPEYRTCLWYTHDTFSPFLPLSVSFAAAVAYTHCVALPKVSSQLVNEARPYLTADRAAEVFPFVSLDEADRLARADLDLWSELTDRKGLPRGARRTAEHVLDDLVQQETAALARSLP